MFCVANCRATKSSRPPLSPSLILFPSPSPSLSPSLPPSPLSQKTPVPQCQTCTTGSIPFATSLAMAPHPSPRSCPPFKSKLHTSPCSCRMQTLFCRLKIACFNSRTFTSFSSRLLPQISSTKPNRILAPILSSLRILLTFIVPPPTQHSSKGVSYN